MRLIFFVLLGVNLLLLGWKLLAVSDKVELDPQPSQRTSDVPRIHLLDEVSDQSRPDARPSAPDSAEPLESGQSPASVTDSGATVAPGKALCTFIGPFDGNDQAAQLVERLAAMEVDGSVVDVEIPAGQGYWVHLPPLESRREALRRLSELQARDIDSYVIPKGELMNGISLGMFSQKSLAEARLAEMVELGLGARIEMINRSYKEIWVSVPDASARKLGDQAWQRLLESDKNTDRRQNFCLHVASQDNIH